MADAAEERRPPISGPDGLLRALEEILADPAFVPPVLPRVAFRVNEMIARGAPSTGELVSVVESDPLVAADLLRLARSPYYVRRSPPSNLQDAVLLLGLEEVRNLVWQIGLAGKVFRAPAFRATMASVRRHSVATAHLARLVARASVRDLEDVFLAGLLHDAGLAVSLVVLAERQDEIPPGTRAEDLDAVLHAFHEGAGAVLAALWGLATPLARVLGDHHGSQVGRSMTPLQACVVAGQTLANAHGAMVRHEDGLPFSADPPEVILDARRRLGLGDDAAWTALGAEARELLDDLPA